MRPIVVPYQLELTVELVNGVHRVYLICLKKKIDITAGLSGAELDEVLDLVELELTRRAMENP